MSLTFLTRKTSSNPSEFGNKGDDTSVEKDDRLSSVNTLMTKNLSHPILKLSPCSWATLSKSPSIAQAYFIPVFGGLGGQ